MNILLQGFKEHKDYFIIFLLSNLTSYLSGFFNFWVFIVLVFINDYVWLCLLAGLKESREEGGKPSFLETAGYGKRFILRALGAHLLLVFFLLIFMFFIQHLVTNLNFFYKLSITGASLIGFFLIYVFSSMVWSDFKILESIISGVRNFFIQKNTSLLFFIIVLVLSYFSANIVSRLQSFISYFLLVVCFWAVCLKTAFFLRQNEEGIKY